MTEPQAQASPDPELRRDECRRRVRLGASYLVDNDHERIQLEHSLARDLAEAKAAGIDVPELARLIGSSRQHVYRQLKRAQQ